uniref:Serpentine receptor class gamma n=1 Tax=Meloidogyne floridensis TaxID=298350 RepID=A0A915NFW1_9BILA
MFCLLASAISADPNYPVTGNLSDFNGLPILFDTRNMFIVLLVLSILAHILVGILAKYKGDLTDEKMRKLFRSISLIILLNIGGYFLYLASILASIAFITKNPVMIWYLGCYNALILNISAALNAPILYMNSSDYNEAYNKEFGRIKKFYVKCKSAIFKNSVHTSSVTVF